MTGAAVPGKRGATTGSSRDGRTPLGPSCVLPAILGKANEERAHDRSLPHRRHGPEKMFEKPECLRV